MIDQNIKVAWYCRECGRMEGDAKEKYCPDCGEKRQRCSRYEWFLSDAILYELEKTDRLFSIVEQFPVHDHRGFDWFFDIYVHVRGKNSWGGIKVLVEVNGDSHSTQKKYSSGYTHDFDKHWEVFSNLRLHKFGYEYLTIENDKCKKAVVSLTAKELVQKIINLSDTYC